MLNFQDTNVLKKPTDKFLHSHNCTFYKRQKKQNRSVKKTKESLAKLFFRCPGELFISPRHVFCQDLDFLLNVFLIIHKLQPFLAILEPTKSLICRPKMCLTENLSKHLFHPRMFCLPGSSTNTYVVIQTLLIMLLLEFKPSEVLHMIKKRSCSLITKINWHFSDMVKIRFIMTNNVNIFTLYESLL